MRRRYLYGVVTAAVVAACRAAAIEVMNEIDLDLSRERVWNFRVPFRGRETDLGQARLSPLFLLHGGRLCYLPTTTIYRL